MFFAWQKDGESVVIITDSFPEEVIQWPHYTENNAIEYQAECSKFERFIGFEVVPCFEPRRKLEGRMGQPRWLDGEF